MIEGQPASNNSKIKIKNRKHCIFLFFFYDLPGKISILAIASGFEVVCLALVNQGWRVPGSGQV